jgi:hypothetical protein
VHIVGAILLVAGLYMLYRAHRFPPLHDFPSQQARIDEHVFFGIFGANGWTGMGTAIAGGLLLFGSAQHLMAKTIGVVTGIALLVAAIIALISGRVLGLAAANGWTELLWGGCGLVVLIGALMPARRRTVEVPVAASPADEPALEHSTGEHPADEPAGEHPADEHSADEHPADEHPADEPGVEDPISSPEPARRG